MHPVLISFGPLHLSTYGAAVATGYLAAILWLKSQMSAMRLDEKLLASHLLPVLRRHRRGEASVLGRFLPGYTRRQAEPHR